MMPWVIFVVSGPQFSHRWARQGTEQGEWTGVWRAAGVGRGRCKAVGSVLCVRGEERKKKGER